MIISYASYGTSLCTELIKELDVGSGIVPPREQSHKAMLKRSDEMGGRLRFVDFQWSRDAGLEIEWIQGEYGARSKLRKSSSKRQEFFRTVGNEIPNGPLTSATGGVNEGARSRDHIKELLGVRDDSFAGRSVTASFVVDRSGLSDSTVIADLGPVPLGVTEIALSVMDTVDYPSTWTYENWYGWLKLIRAFVEAGYEVILPYSDVRGLIGVGVGARELGTGPQQDLRQLRPARPRKKSKGAAASVSYVSIPLLSVVHGINASVDSEWSDIESHVDCSEALGVMEELHSQASSFDVDWMGAGLTAGTIRDNRIDQHLRSLATAETAIMNGIPEDAVEEQLEEAASIGSRVSGATFKSPGGQSEVGDRLDAFQAIRRDLSF